VYLKNGMLMESIHPTPLPWNPSAGPAWKMADYQCCIWCTWSTDANHGVQKIATLKTCNTIVLILHDRLL